MIQRSELPLVALAGNPNTGKTTVFNRLTGHRAKVGNYPGVTVDRQMGKMELPGGLQAQLMDVPGTYSLSSRSEEEQIAIRAVAGLHPLERPNAVVVVVDATQLTRNLYLVLQVIEIALPVVVALNMSDMLEASGQRVDHRALAEDLGVPVIPIVASRGMGMGELQAAIAAVLEDPSRGLPEWRWAPDDPVLREDMTRVGEAIPDDWHDEEERRREALALWALLSIDDDDELAGIPDELRGVVESRRGLAESAGRELDQEIIRRRYDWIDARAERFLTEVPLERLSLTDRIDRVFLHPVTGFALFLLLMTIVFQSLFSWADPAIELVEAAFAWLGNGVRGLAPAGWFTDLVVEGIINGVGSVIVFLPQILLLFFFIGLMEDTGYMARVAFLMDRIMKGLGLHGRAFVPMLSGYACAIPAILATRTMERKRDRILTMMVVPLMTCSARLPVYGLLIAALYPPDADRPFAQGMLLVGMYLFSTVIALLAAGVLGRTVLKGPRVPLIMEMPPYRMPHLPSVLRMMWTKSSVFIKEAGTVILTCTVILWVLLNHPKDPNITAHFEERRAEVAAQIESDGGAAEDLELAHRLTALDAEESGELLRTSYAGRLGRWIEPTIAPLGFDWKVGIGLVGAFAAREVFVSTMAVVYGLDASESETSESLRKRVRDQKRVDGSRLYTPLVCFSLMVFFALACQCMSTLAVVKRETASWRWPTFLFAYMSALAWVASFAVFQGGRLLGFS